MKKAVGALTLAVVFLFSGCGLVGGVMKAPSSAAVVTQEPAAADETGKETAVPPDNGTAEPSAETAVGTVAAATPEPTQEPAPAAANVTVEYGDGAVTVAGIDASGAGLWEREFTIETETELVPYSDAAIDGNAVYLQVDYHMTALDAATGGTLWTSELEGGFCTPVTAGGMVYACSYYGSPLVIFAEADGDKIFEAPLFDDSFFWPSKIELADGQLTVCFDQAGDGDHTGTAVFNLDGEFVSKKVE